MVVPLNKGERKVLRSFFEYSPCARQAYDFREEFTAISDMNCPSNKPNRSFSVGYRKSKKVDCFVLTTSSVCSVIGGKKLLTFLFTEKIAAS
jgi:hypothetical protein